jgi:tetratricopeptide (TPR) repeat protein
MRRLIIAALSALILLCTPFSDPQGCGLHSIRWTPLMINLLIRAGAPAATSLRPVAPPAQAPVNERGAAPSAQESVSLEPGKPVERELSGGQSHFYKIAMTSGQYLRITVSQRGIDVLVVLFTPNDKKISEADREHLIERSETVSVIAEASGAYLIEVRSPEKTAKAGRYEIKVEELIAATTEDKYRVAAESAFREAEQLQNGTLEAKRTGIEKYQEALELYRRASDSNGEAQSLNNIGEVYYSLGEMQKALEKYNEALSPRQAVGDRNGEADTLNNIGLVYWSQGEMQKALGKFDEALPISRAAGDRGGEAFTLSNIGLVYQSLGEPRRALERYNGALLLRRAIGDRSGEATTLNNIGQVYWSQGEMQKALEKFDEALPIRRAVGNRSGEAFTLNNIGAVYYSLGETQKALEKFDEALSLRRALGDRRGNAQTLNNIGAVYKAMGEPQKALEKYNEALPIFQAAGDRAGEAGTLGNIGAVYKAMGEMQKALEKYNEALPIHQAVGDRRVEAITLNNIGAVYGSLGETQKALDKYNEALLLSRAVGNRSGEAFTLNNIGAIYDLLGEMQKALEKHNEALLIFQEVGDRNGEATALLGVARVEQKRGNLTQARQTIEQAVNLIESLRINVVSQEFRASYFASRQDFFETYIDVLMQMRKQNATGAFDAAALAVSERARARSLLELLKESRADIRQGVDSSLLERERSLQQRLNARAAEQARLLNRKHTPEQADAAAKEIATITTEYEEIEAQIRARSPRYAALTQPQPLSPTEIQQQALDEDTLLLEYALGEKHSYLWLVSQRSIDSYELPPRAEVEAAARRVYELLTARPKPWTPPDPQFIAQARTLSRMLLGPVASQLGGKRLVVVAPGALSYLPFAALPAPDDKERPAPAARRKADKKRQAVYYKSLIAEHEIVSIPSASVLSIIRREMEGRQRAAKSVAVLAIPSLKRTTHAWRRLKRETPPERHAPRRLLMRGIQS